MFAKTNHLFFNRYEPRSANGPLIFLAIEPLALLSFLGGQITPARLIWSYAAFLGSLALSVVTYRLSPFHPLANVKGPTMGKITKLWGCWIAGRGYQYLYHKKLHDKYGAYVRIGARNIFK